LLVILDILYNFRNNKRINFYRESWKSSLYRRR